MKTTKLRVTHTIERSGEKINHKNNLMEQPVIKNLGPVMKAAAFKYLQETQNKN